MDSLFGLMFLLGVASAFVDPPPPPHYETKYFTALVDNFNLEITDTYQERYLYADKYWGTKSYPNGCKGPIFFYTGNESPVTDYYKASGLFTQVLAPKYGALLVFAEHRYFGESLPYGSKAFERGNIGYLSPQQALADYARLIQQLKTTLEGAANCPVIAFGGSYGGMLTTWFRLRYPNVVYGGLAGSAPFSFDGSGISPYAFADACTNTFETSGKGCVKSITTATDSMFKMSKTAAGRAELSKKFKLCAPLKSEEEGAALVDWIMNGIAGMAMMDYPYETDYGISVSAWPVNNTCSRIASQEDKVEGLAYGMGTFYNNTGEYACYNTTSDHPDWGAGLGWPYLACTSVYIPYATRGVLLPPSKWEPKYDIARCKKQFGVTLDPTWPELLYGGIEAIKQSSNIIFSNGLLDPWNTGGIEKSLSDSLIAIVIPAAAHHLDLRGPNKADPPYVTAAREQEDKIIGGWIKEYFNQ